jgi:hypothetical protein
MIKVARSFKVANCLLALLERFLAPKPSYRSLLGHAICGLLTGGEKFKALKVLKVFKVFKFL